MPKPKLYVMRTAAQAAGLRDMVRATGLAPGFRMAELGSFAGESMAIFVGGGARDFLAVDLWERATYRADIPVNARPDWAEAEFDRRMRTLRELHPDLVIRKAKISSQRAVLLCPDRSLDLFYVDALHTTPAVRADIRAWLPKLKPGGFAAGHDWTWKAVRRGVVEALGHLGEPQLFRDSSWLYQVAG